MEILFKRKVDVSWKNTFNSNLKMHGVENAFAVAKNNGYPFVAWNGWVYDVYSRGCEDDRIILADELPT
jgi:hypothetical protein